MIQHSLKQWLQRRKNIFISVCMVCCKHISADGKEGSVTQQLPPCYMGKSQTQSCSIFHLIKCKVASQPAGGRRGKSSRLISSSSQHRAVTHVRLCLSYQAPGEMNSVCHITVRWSLAAMFVYKTPQQGNQQHSAKSRNSQDGARLCYPGSQQKMQLCSSGFASLVMRCCFSLCWGHGSTTDNKKPQADKWAEIICYFRAFQYSISFSYKSVKPECPAVPFSCCGMWVWALQLCRQAAQPDRLWLWSLIDLSIQKRWGMKKT